MGCLVWLIWSLFVVVGFDAVVVNVKVAIPDVLLFLLSLILFFRPIKEHFNKYFEGCQRSEPKFGHC